jgi:hypothetical protein
MPKIKIPKMPKKYLCEKCAFNCAKLSNYNKHLSTAKHINLTNPNNKSQKNAQLYKCDCGKEYKHSSTLSNHKRTCNGPQNTPGENTFIKVEDKMGKIIEEIMKDSQEMKNLVIMLMKNQQEVVQNNREFIQTNQQLAQKQQENTVEIITDVMKSLPPMCNTINANNTNSHNNTLNFYLTHTCKDAESIHDFTERFIAKSIEFFKDNYRQVASNQVDLASSVYDIMNKCLNEKPQIEKFIQTTDSKNGILYVKEKKKDEQRQFYGDAEFVKHVDGFEKTGMNIEQSINKVFLPMKDEFTELMRLELGNAPKESNFDDEDKFEEEMHNYKNRVMELKRNMCLQIYNTSTIFDKKHIRNEILERTKRIKEQSMNI